MVTFLVTHPVTINLANQWQLDGPFQTQATNHTEQFEWT